MKDDLVTLFQAAGDATRLRLLNLLDTGELCVCYFVEILGESQPKISRHLAYLRRAGLVASRRQGKWIHYRLQSPTHRGTRAVFEALLETLRTDPVMERDRNALLRACCAVRLPETIRDAPRPELRPH